MAQSKNLVTAHTLPARASQQVVTHEASCLSTALVHSASRISRLSRNRTSLSRHLTSCPMNHPRLMLL